MEFTKIKICSRDDAKRFYRILAVREDIDLCDLGAVIGLSINCWFEHVYYFKCRSKDVCYVPDVWMKDTWTDIDHPMSKATIDDLTEKFIYEYDMGEGWEFDCRILKTKYKAEFNTKDAPLGFVIEGKGAGIFENDHHTFWRYLAGEIDPNISEDNENERIYMPMNMEFETLGDFDKPLDLEKMRYYEDDVDGFTCQYKTGYDEDDDDYDDEDKIEVAQQIIRNSVAGECFNNEKVNKVFRKLIKNHDINEAYEMIYNVFVDCISEDITSLDDCEKLIYKELKKLK